jgi:hypothetical protein
MDVWIALQPENAERVVGALREFGFDLPELRSELFLNEKAIIRMGTPPIRLEITTGISGVEFDECYKSRVIDLLDGIQVNIIGLEHLKINKKASGRLKDLADLENLP